MRPEQRPVVGQRRTPSAVAPPPRARPASMSTTADQLDLRVRGVLLGVEPPEVARPRPPPRAGERSSSHLPRRGRPPRRRCRPRRRARSSPSRSSDDRAARLDRQRAPAHLRDGPDRLRADGRAGRSACPASACRPSPRTMSPFTSCPARRMVASVPSMPSTATTAPPRTTTLCPMSNCPITFAARKPKRMSAHSSGVGGRARRARRPRARSPADTASTRRPRCPRVSSSAATRPQEQVVAQRADTARATASARASGLKLAEQARLRDAAHHDGARARRPACRASIIASSSPGVHPGDRRRRRRSSSGRVSPRCATATTSTPRRRAVSAKSTGKRPLPAMRPMRSMPVSDRRPRCDAVDEGDEPLDLRHVPPSSARTCAERARARLAAAVEEQAVGALAAHGSSSAEKPRRRSPTTFRPNSRARSPATVQNGGTSIDTIAPAAQSADSPTRTNWCTPREPADDGVVSDRHVAAERDAVGEDDVVAQRGSRARRATTP